MGKPTIGIYFTVIGPATNLLSFYKATEDPNSFSRKSQHAGHHLSGRINLDEHNSRRSENDDGHVDFFHTVVWVHDKFYKVSIVPNPEI